MTLCESEKELVMSTRVGTAFWVGVRPVRAIVDMRDNEGAVFITDWISIRRTRVRFANGLGLGLKANKMDYILLNELNYSKHHESYLPILCR